MSAFEQYRRKQIAELRPYVSGEKLSDNLVSISAEDIAKEVPSTHLRLLERAHSSGLLLAPANVSPEVCNGID